MRPTKDRGRKSLWWTHETTVVATEKKPNMENEVEMRATKRHENDDWTSSQNGSELIFMTAVKDLLKDDWFWFCCPNKGHKSGYMWCALDIMLLIMIASSATRGWRKWRSNGGSLITENFSSKCYSIINALFYIAMKTIKKRIKKNNKILNAVISLLTIS